LTVRRIKRGEQLPSSTTLYCDDACGTAVVLSELVLNSRICPSEPVSLFAIYTSTETYPHIKSNLDKNDLDTHGK